MKNNKKKIIEVIYTWKKYQTSKKSKQEQAQHNYRAVYAELSI